jgi:Flp pilus assembly protein TadD
MTSVYDKLFGEHAEERDSLLEAGASLSRLGRLEEAEEAFRKAIRIGPPSAEAHLRLGLLLEQSGRHRDAETEYRTASGIDSEKAETHILIGNLFLRSNKCDEAEKEFRAAIAIQPNSLEAHTNLGALLLKMERFDEAERELRRAVSINPNVGLPHRNLGAVFAKTQRIEEAIKEFELATRLHREEGDHEAVKKLEQLIARLRGMSRFDTDTDTRARRGRSIKTIPEEESTISDESRGRANRVLNQLFEVWIDPNMARRSKQRLISDIVRDNRDTIFGDTRFFELLDAEITKTKRHGPAFMALMYLELQWALTGDKKHLRELEDYSHKAKKMTFEELTGIRK